jgi:hypothetical protein
LLFVSGPQLALWLHHAELASAAQVVALSLPCLVLGQVARAGLTGLQDVRLSVVLEQLAVPVATAVVFVVVHLRRPADVAAPVVAAAVAQVGVGLVSWVALRARVAHEGAVVSWQSREWLRFSLPLWLERGLLFVVASSGYGFLARFGDPGSVGTFGAAVRVAGVVGMPMLAVSAIFGPTISNLAARGEWQTLQVLYARLTWALAGVGAILGVAVAAGSRWVLAGFGPSFATASGALAILAAGQVVNSATGPSGLVLIMSGRTGRRLANAGIGAALTVGLSWFAVPRWGAAGAAGALALSSSIVNVVQVDQVRRHVGLWAYDRQGFPTSLRRWLGCHRWPTPAHTTRGDQHEATLRKAPAPAHGPAAQAHPPHVLVAPLSGPDLRGDPMIGLGRILTCSDRVVAQQAQGEQVLLALDTGHYYTLNEVGSTVWALFDGSASLASVVTAVCAEFEAPPQVVEADVVELVRDLLDEGLLVEAG